MSSTDIVKFYNQQSFLVQQVQKQFKNPIHQNVFFENKAYLISNADRIVFNNELWHLRPEMFCYDFYSEPLLFPVILVINDISTRFNFRVERFIDGRIIAPKIDAIRKVALKN